jgi:hypothetical protein
MFEHRLCWLLITTGLFISSAGAAWCGDGVNPQWKQSTETFRSLVNGGFEIRAVQFVDGGMLAGRRIILQKGPRVFWCFDPVGNETPPAMPSCSELK